MHRLALALLMLNILYLLWAALRPAPANVHDGDRFGESLVLLEDVDRALLVPLPDIEPTHVSSRESSPERCLILGPFDNESALQEFAGAHLADRQWRTGAEELALSPLSRVYVPPSDAGPRGASLLVSVRDAILRAGYDVDSYLVVGGDLDGVVSLGLFAGQDNARRVYEQITGLGIAVEMQTENRVRTVYSVVIASDESSDFIQESAAALQALETEAGITEKLCEMIALPD